ncbi:MAG: hypothetical protein HQK67_05650 [Desulfamplus sp.]|nr:hypothetical protein [Desulfamplus sp.]
MLSNKRSTIRNQCRIPLLLAWKNPDECHEVVAYNISKSGMCIESCWHLSPDTPLYIKNVDPTIVKKSNATGEAFVAKVKWSRKKRFSYVYAFDVGIQHLTHCYFMDHISDYSDSLSCDMCYDIINNDLHQTKDNLNLCKECFWNIGSLGKSVTQSSVRRFISGNVL